MSSDKNALRMQIFAASEFSEVSRDKDKERREIYNERSRLRDIYGQRARNQEQRLHMIELRKQK